MRRLILLCALLLALGGLGAGQSFAAVAYETNGAGAGQVSVVALPFPTGISAGNLLYVCLGNKYPTNGPALPTDAFGGTWVAPSGNQGTADPGDGPGSDVGATYATVFYKVATGTETGNLTITATSATGIYGFMARYSNATGLWSVAAANGGDATSGTAWSATMGTNPGIHTGDLVLACSGRNNSSSVGSSPSISTAGVTYGTHTERLDNGTAFGDNVGAYVTESTVTGGPSSAAPVYTFTGSANTAGGTVLLRIREASAGQTAASCSSTDINAAITAAVDGETVHIPACAETTMTAQISIPSTKGITLLGAGEGVTNLKDGGVTTEPIRVAISPANSRTEVSGFTLNSNNNVTSNYAAIAFYGTGLDSFRLHHVTVTNVLSRGVVVGGNVASGGTAEFTGLIDHVKLINTTAGSPQGFNVNGSWNAANQGGFLYDQQPGTNHATYIEDSECDFQSNADACIDSPRSGGNVVFRNNTLNGIGLGFHGADSSLRGMHLIELYRNIFTKVSAGNIGAMNYRAGPYVAFDNIWTGNYTAGSIALQIYRARTDQSNYGAAGGPCNGLNAWDGNTIANGALGEGYPCLDQAGWYFPGITANGAGAIQRPTYMFNNLINGVDTSPAPGFFGAPNTKAQSDYVVANRDFYTTAGASCSGASCTTGVGRGILADRPASCTTGVAYLATDQGSWNTSGDGLGSGLLYKCTATDTWTLYYTPYAYPHPLQGAASPPAPDALASAHMANFQGATFAVFIWTASIDVAHKAYNIYRCLTADPCTSLIATVTPASAAAAHSPETRWIDQTLYTAGTRYYSVSDVNLSDYVGPATTPVPVTVTGKQ